MKLYARDIIEAAKSDKSFDKVNAQQIANDYNIPLVVVREEIVFVRKNLHKIDPAAI